ncbi:MAG: chemotaxis response regulator protein-glutamate methylesterase [Leptospiraceae bacterium]|nr:chemotaxis response regulator protein-glutamate methylesterase [Leptospiraceae bacterium]MCP5493977.1 chemotaxis response regulator protein-glutamate methylesterase [Leptospiraceae bacterium]
MKKIRVLIVDDQSAVRRVIRRALSVDPMVEVIAEASDPYSAVEMIEEHDPDVMTLDVEMPRMNGIDFLRKLMPQHPMPVIMLSALTQEGAKVTMDALDIGAVDYIAKPSGDPEDLEKVLSDLVEKVKMAASVNMTQFLKYHSNYSTAKSIHKPITTIKKKFKYNIIAIGASTGGTNAIQQIISQIDSEFPGIVVVQHMPPGFTRIFADRLNSRFSINVKEAVDGEIIEQGKVLIAPGDYHLTLSKVIGGYCVKLNQKEKVNLHRPSVDTLFHSIANGGMAPETVAIQLTGMGRDGAEGLLNLRQKRARTICQDKESSVVYGMPETAFKLGAAEFQVPLDKIVIKIKEILGFTNG